MNQTRQTRSIPWLPLICFGLLMMALGINDALRGIFAPIFQERYALSDTKLSFIVTVSYAGNLLFLSIGGKLLDTFPRKRVTAGAICLWGLALVINLVSDNYYCILLTMFLALGASTLLNTTLNILAPAVFCGYGALMVNVLFFLQGVGTSGSQFLLGRYGFSFGGWKFINAFMLAAGVIVLVLLSRLNVPQHTPTLQPDGAAAPAAARPEPARRVFWFFVAMFGFYFIGEHGIMNWLLSYCISAFSMPAAEASGILSLFWGGMTLGRLLLAPVVQKLGAQKSLYIFGGAGTLLFVLGVALGSSGLLILGASGFLISVLYPTMVLLIQQIYPETVAATRTGTIISLATLADIAFNSLFGAAIDAFGYRMSFAILPVGMVLYYAFYLLLMRSTRSKAN